VKLPTLELAASALHGLRRLSPGARPTVTNPKRDYDAVVVGAGPNGLAAAIELALGGQTVLVLEQQPVAGGGMRSAELTLPGYTHDICSAVHPLAVSSPFLRRLALSDHGLEWIQPPTPLAHPFDDGTAALLERSISETAVSLGDDGRPYARLLSPLAARWLDLAADILAPLRVPHHPLLFARFALGALRSARGLATHTFRGDHARALFAGIAAHASVQLTAAATAAFGLTLAAAGHGVGWPIARGGSQRIADAMIAVLRSLGGEVVTGAPVRSLDDLPSARIVMLDLTPRQILGIAGSRLPSRYRDALARFRYSVGAFKVDWALSAPIPWRSSECARAGTVHVGGTLEEIALAERLPWLGEHPEQPFVLLGQPTVFDATRAPVGCHTAWAYCHVPPGSTVDMTSRLENQVERFAPGFRDLILARSVMPPAVLERHDANLIGGDFSSGVMDLRQLFFRPVVRLKPYRTPVRGLYICSASTPPGGAVHGMCGYHAARTALGDIGVRSDPASAHRATPV